MVALPHADDPHASRYPNIILQEVASMAWSNVSTNEKLYSMNTQKHITRQYHENKK
jgi:hypothetical protein